MDGRNGGGDTRARRGSMIQDGRNCGNAWRLEAFLAHFYEAKVPNLRSIRDLSCRNQARDYTLTLIVLSYRTGSACFERWFQTLIYEFTKGKEPAEKGKGCDFGYAPAICSCEGARQHGCMYRRSP